MRKPSKIYVKFDDGEENFPYIVIRLENRITPKIGQQISEDAIQKFIKDDTTTIIIEEA